MEETLPYTSKYLKITLNPIHKVSKEVRHVLDMEFDIKSWLDS